MSIPAGNAAVMVDVLAAAGDAEAFNPPEKQAFLQVFCLSLLRVLAV
jgi:hypothetical protein